MKTAATGTTATGARVGLCLAIAGAMLTTLPQGAAGSAVAPVAASRTGADPRLREVTHDPHGVVTVPVKRGMVTLVMLDADESITELAAGLGGDCSKTDSAWCIAAQPGGRTVFIKPKSSATAASNLAIVTNRRSHNLQLQVLADDDPRQPLYRLAIKAPIPGQAPARPALRAGDQSLADSATERSQQRLRQAEASLQALLQASVSPPAASQQLLSERMQAKPSVLNTRYSLAEGKNSEDIVPTLVFDDGRFTYLRLPGNREMPAAFQVMGDGSEALVNGRMEEDLLVVDRVTRQLVLRAGSAVVGLWNEAFDIEGVQAEHGTTVPGLRRALRSVQPIEGSRFDGGAP